MPAFRAGFKIYNSGANSDDTHERQCIYQMHQRPATGQYDDHHHWHNDDDDQGDRS